MSEAHNSSSSRDHHLGSDQSRVLDSMWRHRVLVVVLTLLGAGAGMALTSAQPTVYQAESRVFLSSQAAFDPTGVRDFVNDPSRFVEEQAAVMTSTIVLESALESGAPAGSVIEMRELVEVEPAKDADILTVRASSVSEREAKIMVNLIVRAYRNHVDSSVAATMNQIEGVLTPIQLQRAQRQAALFDDGVSFAEPAAARQTSSAIRNAVLLGLVGLLCSIGISLLRDRRPVAAPPTAAGPYGRPAPETARRPRPSLTPAPAPAMRERAQDLSPEAS